MSIEAIRQVTETEQANKQSRAAAEAEARQLILDAERNGTELLKKVRSDAAEQGKDLLRQAEERAAQTPGSFIPSQFTNPSNPGGEPAPARAGGTAFG